MDGIKSWRELLFEQQGKCHLHMGFDCRCRQMKDAHVLAIGEGSIPVPSFRAGGTQRPTCPPLLTF